MAITSQVYPVTLMEFFKTDAQLNWELTGSIDWVGSLVKDAYTPDDAHSNVTTHISTNLASSPAIDKDLTITDPTNGEGYIEFDASNANINFGAVVNGEEVNGMVVHNSVTEDMICICEFAVSSVTGDGVNDVIITFGANGLWRITYTPF